MGVVERVKEFFNKNWKPVLAVVLVLFIILLTVSANNIKFKEHRNKEVEKIIFFEKFSNREGFKEGQAKPFNIKDAKFCKRKIKDLENACMSLTENDCKLTQCCIWAKPKNNPPVCWAAAHDGNGAGYDANKKELEWWWYKGPNKNLATKRIAGTHSQNYAPREHPMIEKKEPLSNTSGVVKNLKKQKAAAGAAQDTLKQAKVASLTQENEMKQLQRKQELAAVVAKHQRAQQLDALKQKHQLENTQASVQNLTNNALKKITLEQAQKKVEKDMDAQKLQMAINQTAAVNASPKQNISDQVAITKSQIGIESKKRELQKLLEQQKHQSVQSNHTNVNEQRERNAANAAAKAQAAEAAAAAG